MLGLAATLALWHERAMMIASDDAVLPLTSVAGRNRVAAARWYVWLNADVAGDVGTGPDAPSPRSTTTGAICRELAVPLKVTTTAPGVADRMPGGGASMIGDGAAKLRHDLALGRTGNRGDWWLIASCSESSRATPLQSVTAVVALSAPVAVNCT